MHRRMISAGFGAGALALLFLRLDVKDDVYAMPVAAVNDHIDRLALPSLLLEVAGLTARHWRLDEGTSIWALLDPSGAERLRISATTSAEGEGARVRVDVLPPNGAYHDKVEQNIRERAQIVDVYKVTVAEQIDADLNGREFNMKRLSPSVARFMIASLPRIREAADAAAKEHERQEQEGVDRAYANEK